MFNDDKDYTSYDGGYDEEKDKSDSYGAPKTVWSSDEYGLPVKEQKEDDYAPAYVDNTYTNSFGNSLAGAFAGAEKKNEEKKSEPKPHVEEKRYLGTNSFGFTKRPENTAHNSHIFNKPKENREDKPAFGGFSANTGSGAAASARDDGNRPDTAYARPEPQSAYSQRIESKPVWSQPVEPVAYSQPAEPKSVWSQPQEQTPLQSRYGDFVNGADAQNGGYSRGYDDYSQRGANNGYNDGYSPANEGYSYGNSYDNGYGNYNAAQESYGQETYNAADSAPAQMPLSKEEIKRQQRHDALLQKEQDRQQKEKSKLDKLNQKEQARRQKAADKQALFEERERQRQEAVEQKRRQDEEAEALKRQKAQEAEEKKLADKQAKEEQKRLADEQKEQAKLDKQNKKEQAKLEKEQAKFDKQNKKEEAKQAKLDKKQQALLEKQQAKSDKQSKKSKTTDEEGFADMTEYNEEKKRTPEETDMLGGDFVSAVYGAPAASATASSAAAPAAAQSKPAAEQPYVPRFVSGDRQTVLVTLPDKENMTRKQRKIAKKASRFDEMDLRNYPMTVGKWLGTLIILAIPVINFLACIFWFFGVGNKSRTALIRCFLVIWLIALVILAAALGVGYYFLAQKAQQEVGAQSVNEVLIYGVDYLYDALGPVIGEDKLLPIRNAIVTALGGQEIQSSAGSDTEGSQTGESVTP